MLKITEIRRLTVGPVSFKVAPGECVAITGGSGSGKSLLLRAIADLDINDGEASAGSLLRSGTPAPTWRQTVTYVASEPGWWADRVGDHFAGAHDDLNAWLTLLGLPTAALDWQVSRCSSGERQRLGLVRALCHGPSYLLLDEPTGALDSDSTAAVEKLLKERLDAGLGIVLVTHDLPQVRRLRARHLTLHNGALQQATQ